MLDKLPGTVRCAHCHERQAQRPCPRCGLLVCATCDDTGCTLPGPRQLRLGLGWRLRAVDPQAEHGFARSTLGAERLLHLASGTEVHLPDLYRSMALERLGPCWLGAGQAAWLARVRRGGGRRQLGARQQVGLMVAPLRRARLGRCSFVRLALATAAHGSSRLRPQTVTALGGGQRYLVTVDNRLFSVPLDAGPVQSRTLSGERAITAVSASLHRDLLALRLAGGGALLLRLSDLQPLGALHLGRHRCRWLQIVGHRLALITSAAELLLFPLGAAGQRPAKTAATRLQLRPRGALGAREASLSPDGELLAVRQHRRQVAVHTLSTGVSQTLRHHTDRVSLVRFAAQGSTLVTADDDNRVVLWPCREGRVMT